MPLHLTSIMKDSNSVTSDVIAWILKEGMESAHVTFYSEDKQYIHLQSDLVDRLSGALIGKVTYTLKIKQEEKSMEILDVDITLRNEVPVKLRFLTLRKGSSDANEYYEVETESGSRLEIETVNRHGVHEDLLEHERAVSISAFPFRVNVCENIGALNAQLGFKDPVLMKGTDQKVIGFSEKFIMPGGAWNQESDESYSFLIGTVVSFLDVEVRLGSVRLPFAMVWLDTALGVIPVAMGRTVFDLSRLKEGAVVGMYADIKADLAV